MTALCWLEPSAEWRTRLKACAASGAAWPAAIPLANTCLDFIRTNQLDEVLRRALGDTIPADLAAKPVRLAILGSCTTAQLHPAIRVAGLRRNIHVTVYEAEYGQYWQELTDTDSGLHAFNPTIILFALDAHHLTAGVNAARSEQEADAALEDVQNRLRECWRLAREHFRCPIIQQTPLPVHPTLLGNNEHRLPGSKFSFVARLNASLRPMADAAGVDLLTIDDRAARDGLAAWHDFGLWHRAKQEISPAAAPMYGDLVGRIIAAKLGKSYKCLVLDLDNTLWGGVIGDDGMEGIVLGQGSALGEAFAAFQDYARELSRRGIILAVCSKNDEANALEPFEKHPEMVFRRGDISAFVANWSDKAANLRAIAEQLNIGLDSLVFVDDNPFERSLVRQELPMVAVPEVGDDPTDYPRILADAGYFEGLAITQEDRERTGQYQGNRLREALKSSATDLPAYLRGLEMELVWRRFDAIGLSRTVQLINKTNQFNLTTRRYAEEDVLGVMRDNRAFGLQLRLLDRFGDNGIISIVIGRMQDDDAEQDGNLLIDTWLMSCRVLGRQVEPTTLNLVAAQAQALGARRLVGEYVPTKKNAMVRDHYERLGFSVTARDAAGGSRAVLDLANFTPAETFIQVREG
jgi:FkbH-like protein